jgi:hypothetical protein
MAGVTELPLIPQRRRCDLEGFQEFVEISCILIDPAACFTVNMAVSLAACTTGAVVAQ